jgi:hypothetical protein
LLDEWLVDVALDRVGKCIAIMLVLTLIERALLPERPAFFVTAGQRGGGKTTLVNMITLAALGRRAAAAAWSENSEERKKALFSYLRQSAHRGGAHRIGHLGSRAGRFTCGNGAIYDGANLHRQFDYAAW